MNMMTNHTILGYLIFKQAHIIYNIVPPPDAPHLAPVMAGHFCETKTTSCASDSLRASSPPANGTGEIDFHSPQSPLNQLIIFGSI